MSSIEPGDAPIAAGSVRVGPRVRRRRRWVRPLIVTVLSLLLFAAIADTGWRWLHSPAASTTPCASASPTGPPPAAVVRVLNGTAHRGLARDTAALLTARGFRITGIGNAPRVKGVSQVRFGAGQNRQAELVSLQLPRSVLVADSKVADRVDLILGGSFTRLRTAAEVAKAKKKLRLPKPTTASPSASPSASCTP